MTFPKSIKVGGKTYTIRYPYIFKERTDIGGQACHYTNEIRIADTTSGGEGIKDINIVASFIHEMLHCVDVVYNAGALDEATVERLGEGLLQVLADNNLLNLKQ